MENHKKNVYLQINTLSFLVMNLLSSSLFILKICMVLSSRRLEAVLGLTEH